MFQAITTQLALETADSMVAAVYRSKAVCRAARVEPQLSVLPHPFHLMVDPVDEEAQPSHLPTPLQADAASQLTAAMPTLTVSVNPMLFKSMRDT